MIQFTPEEKDFMLSFVGFVLISNYLIRLKDEVILENERIENSYEFILDSNIYNLD